MTTPAEPPRSTHRVTALTIAARIHGGTSAPTHRVIADAETLRQYLTTGAIPTPDTTATEAWEAFRRAVEGGYEVTAAVPGGKVTYTPPPQPEPPTGWRARRRLARQRRRDAWTDLDRGHEQEHR